jgi:hypothetical protein
VSEKGAKTLQGKKLKKSTHAVVVVAVVVVAVAAARAPERRASTHEGQSPAGCEDGAHSKQT